MYVCGMQVNGISARGVQLGALVMAGAEAALLANDACGAPVPWLVAAPWLYFDGKLLQRNLARAAHCKHLAQLCDNHLDTVVKVPALSPFATCCSLQPAARPGACRTLQARNKKYCSRTYACGVAVPARTCTRSSAPTTFRVVIKLTDTCLLCAVLQRHHAYKKFCYMVPKAHSFYSKLFIYSFSTYNITHKSTDVLTEVFNSSDCLATLLCTYRM